MNGSRPAKSDARTPEQRSGRLSVAALRSAVAGRMWGGKGCGAPCDYCRVHLSAEEVEYEVEAELAEHTLLLHFHPRCYDAWQTSRGDPQSGPPESPEADPQLPR